MEKGSATSITQVLAQYNKKALPELLLRGGFLPAKTPADRGKSVNGGRGDVVFRWELLQSEPDGSANSLGEGGLSAQQTGEVDVCRLIVCALVQIAQLLGLLLSLIHI